MGRSSYVDKCIQASNDQRYGRADDFNHTERLQADRGKKFYHKEGKCKKCDYFGVSGRVVNKIVEMWGDFKPKEKDKHCLLNTESWFEKCPARQKEVKGGSDEPRSNM